MRVIFFLPESIHANERFQNLVELVNSTTEAVVTQTIHDLNYNLRQPKHDLAFVVLIPSNQGELTSLIKLGLLLEDRRIVLILPDRDEETTIMGHKLYPRFLTDVEDKSNTLELVINKMLDNLNLNPNRNKKEGKMKIKWTLEKANKKTSERGKRARKTNLLITGRRD